jgi:glucosamine--fructose-6-phosphate aminotransferase (isomerizing)
MNLKDERYNRFALVREMMETPGIINSFDPSCVQEFINAIRKRKSLFLTGEGSSRIFPAKRAISSSLKKRSAFPVITEACTQAAEYALDDYAVFAASNSGQTKEVIRLAMALNKKKHGALFGLTSNRNTKLGEIADRTHVLNCGRENAVAATKSVIEQGLFYDSLIRALNNEKMEGLNALAIDVEKALTHKIDDTIIEIITKAEIVYFAGRNNGVAEELALKTNETTRKKSDFLAGTFAVHGIEEVKECLADGVGMNIIAVAANKTIFPTIIIPGGGEYAEYVQLAAGWNILVETGTALGINPDKPQRARKIGNEFIAG